MLVLLLTSLSTSALAAYHAPAATVAARPRLASALAVSTQPATITATSMVLSGFQFTGITTLQKGAGTVDALTFVMSTASMSGFALAVACHPVVGGFRMQFNLAVPSTSAVAASSTMTLYATELDYITTDTTIPAPATPPYRWTVAAPPPQHMLAADAGTLTSVKFALARLDAPRLTMSSVRSTSSFC